MRRKLRFLGICLCLHLVVSGVMWGGLCVTQRGYNTMHREPIAIASVSVTEQNTRIQVLENSCEFPTFWNDKENPLYFAVFTLSGEPMRFWMNLLSLI